MKINFLNDDSNKFNRETDGLKEYSKNEFGKKNSDDQADDEIKPIEKKEVVEKPEEKVVEKKPEPRKEKKFVEESYDDDVFEKSSKTKFFIWALVLIILGAASYYIYDIFLKSSGNNSPAITEKKNINSIVDSNKIKSKPPVRLSAVNQTKINTRYSTINFVTNIQSYLTTNIKLNMVYYHSDKIYIEVYSNGRESLAKFSRSINNSSSHKANLENTEESVDGQVKARYQIVLNKVSNKNVTSLSSSRLIEELIKKEANKNTVTVSKYLYMQAENMVGISSKSSLGSITGFLKVINENLENVSLLNLSMLQQGSKDEYFLKLNFSILN